MLNAPGTSVFPAQLDDTASLLQAANNAATTLTSAATATDGTLTVASTTAFPAAGALSIDNEILFYAGKTSTTFTGCLRGRDSTGGAAHASGAAVEMRMVAAHHNVLAGAIIQLETKVGSGASIVNKAAAYTLTATDTVVIATATSAFTLTLPTAVGATGRQYTLKKNGGSATITIATTSSQTIDGALTFALTTPWNSITVISDGSNWFII